MKKHIALMLAISTLLVAGCCTKAHVTKWEYQQTPTRLSDQALNQLADEGWSVVCVGTDATTGSFYVLKRPKK